MTDDRAAALEDLVGRLTAALDAAEPKEVAALSREKRLVLAELESLAGSRKGSPIDELAKQRADRRSKASASARPGGSGQQRRKRSS
jgi:hypothetical protein